jgi:hypothetical protein
VSGLLSLLLGLAGPAHATQFEVEGTAVPRQQTAGARVDNDLFAFDSSEGIAAGARLRLESDDGRIGLEMFGAIDTLLAFDPNARAQRWGGSRLLVGFRGWSPLTLTHTILRFGVTTFDIREIEREDHAPWSFASAGLEVRRYSRNRLQMLEGDFLANPRAWGIEIRTRYGFGLGGSQVYLAPGGATSRFQSWKDREIVQVTYQLELALIVRPGNDNGRRKGAR